MEKAYDHLRSRIDEIRERYKVPGIAVTVVREEGRYLMYLLRGVRKIDLPENSPRNPLQDADTFTIGSCSKPVSGYMLANLLKVTMYDWKTTIGEVFTELNTAACRKHFNISDDFLRASIRDMMSHTARFPYTPNFGTDNLLGGLMAGFDAEHIEEYCSRQAEMQRRYNFTITAQQDQPAKVGQYNGGPILPVAMFERITGKYYTELMHEYVFGPLEMTEARYGPAATTALPPNGVWNHYYDFVARKFVPDSTRLHPTARYNPHGPAGALQFSVFDAAKFITAHLVNSQRHGLLSGSHLEETFGFYANNHTVSGWGLDSAGVSRTDPSFHVAYDGDDRASYARLVIFPYQGYGYWVAVNGGGEGLGINIGALVVNAVAKVIYDMLPVWTTSYIP